MRGRVFRGPTCGREACRRASVPRHARQVMTRGTGAAAAGRRERRRPRARLSGQPRPASPAAKEQQPTPGLLVVHRDVEDSRLLGRTFFVLVEGVQVGQLVRGGRVAVNLPAGGHRVQVFSSFSGSPPVEVAVLPGAVVELQVSTPLISHVPLGFEWWAQPPALLLATIDRLDLPPPPKTLS